MLVLSSIGIVFSLLNMCSLAALKQEVICLKHERSSFAAPRPRDALIETLMHERDAARAEVTTLTRVSLFYLIFCLHEVD
ncbi:hypothetical protein BJ741DRAFT_439572 [Chytriomyces cf. hyalinus JEL632]|nr:hypothetical protein BJ741DRAFT_439572 [Chytriomyces cf. hyalinus JEL632]